jgi:hypothetical protein
MKNEKAVLIDEKVCVFCPTVDKNEVASPKFHLYQKGISYKDNYVEGKEYKNYICDNCLEGVKEVLLKCKLKIDNPGHTPFEGFIPFIFKDKETIAKKYIEGKVAF